MPGIYYVLYKCHISPVEAKSFSCEDANVDLHLRI